MLELVIPGRQYYNEETQQFITSKETTLQLEHSLVSLSKWQSKWNKSFLDQKQMTVEQTLDYVRCMTINKNIDPNVYLSIGMDQINEVNKYINSPMTATTINQKQGRKQSRQIVTSELIYYWMISLNIPFECQKWHLNRLLTLIRVCDIKNNPPKKGNKKDMMNQNRALNAARRARSGSLG